MIDQEMTALTGEALPVEFHHGGSWYPGVLVGWRHEPDGTCSLRLRFTVAGLRRTSWLPLAAVRLPEPDRSPLPTPSVLPNPRGSADDRGDD